MTPWYLRRVFGLAPLGWLLAAGAALFVGFSVANWLDDLTAWLPWSDESRLERSEAGRATAESNAAARSLEVEGEREQAARVDTYHTQVIEVRDFTARAETEARSAPDATEPLAADRAARLHAADRFLCDRRPGICPAAAPVDPGGG